MFRSIDSLLSRFVLGILCAIFTVVFAVSPVFMVEESRSAYAYEYVADPWIISYQGEDYAEAVVEGWSSNTEARDDIRSVHRDFFQPMIFKSINDGSGLFANAEDDQKRIDINNAILNGDRSKKYSLYERFGGNLTFPRYWGEEVIETNFIDALYTYAQSADFTVDGSPVDNLSSLADMLATNPTTYDNIFYTERPYLKNDGTDPRVLLKQSNAYGQMGNSIILSWANYFLATSEFLVYVTSLFAGNGLVDLILTLPEILFESSAWKAIGQTLSVIIIFAGAGLAIWVVRNMLKAVKGNGFSLAAFLERGGGALLSLGLCVCLLQAPGMFCDTLGMFLNFGDTVIDGFLNKAAENDEVAKDVVQTTNDDDSVLEATLWSEAVFKPWVQAVFDTDYASLNTRYTESGDFIDDDAYVKNEDSIINQGKQSAQATGDIKVPVGSEVVRNWAALAYSCSSFYHIDTEGDLLENWQSMSEGGENAATIDPTEQSHVWPQAEAQTTQPSIYNDDFKWIDASLNVGNLKYGDDMKSSPYIYKAFYGDAEDIDTLNSAKQYRFLGFEQGLRSLFLGLLLLPILYLGVMKTVYILKVVLSGLIVMKDSFLNVLNPDSQRYSVLKNLKSLITPVLLYFWYSLMILVCIELYKTIGTSDLFIVSVVYLLMAVYLCKAKPNTVKSDITNVAKGFNSIVVAGKKRAKEMGETDTGKRFKENAKNVFKEAKEGYVAVADEQKDKASSAIRKLGARLEEEKDDLFTNGATPEARKRNRAVMNEEKRKAEEPKKQAKEAKQRGKQFKKDAKEELHGNEGSRGAVDKKIRNKLRNDIMKGKEDKYTPEFLEQNGFTPEEIEKLKAGARGEKTAAQIAKEEPRKKADEARREYEDARNSRKMVEEMSKKAQNKPASKEDRSGESTARSAEQKSRECHKRRIIPEEMRKKKDDE